MAETAGSRHGLGDLGKTLGRKVGPLPLGVWLLIGGGVLWYVRKQSASTSTATGTAGTVSQGGIGTDPAGNTGQIDPQTGYVYGSAEDIAALQAQSGASYGSFAGGAAPASTPMGTASGTNTSTGTPTAAGVQPPASGPLPAGSIPVDANGNQVPNFVSATQTQATPNPVYNYTQAGPVLTGYQAGSAPISPSSLTPAEQAAANKATADAYRRAGQTPPAYLGQLGDTSRCTRFRLPVLAVRT